MSEIKKPICHIDPKCTFWPKNQCYRPFVEKNACWNCNQEIVDDLKFEIKKLKEKYEIS